MSRNDADARALSALQEQLDLLGGLRNASPRDPTFKSWRQATVTLFQRLWPGDHERCERFRRVPFSPANPRASVREAREWYSRGCLEAGNLIKKYMEEIQRQGVPGGDAPAGEAPLAGTPVEDDVPILDLSEPGGAADDESAVRGRDDHIVDLGGPAMPEPEEREDYSVQIPKLRMPRVSDERETPRAAPPREDVEAEEPREAAGPADEAAPDDGAESAPPRLSTPGAPRNRAEAPNAPAQDAPRGKARKPEKNAEKNARKPGPRQRLKDLLGLGHIAQEPAARATPAPATPREPAPADEPVTQAPLEQAPPDAERPVVTTRQSGRKPGDARSVVSIESLISPEFRNAPAAGPLANAAPPAGAQAHSAPARPAPAPAPDAREAPADDDQAPARARPGGDALDADAFERAAQDFLASSPVLGANARPVQRPGEGSEFLDPDASAVAALAAEVSRLGVPEGRRAGTRALLLDLARRLEAADLDWGGLRVAVSFAMEHPELARRLVPILLPWLDRAA